MRCCDMHALHCLQEAHDRDVHVIQTHMIMRFCYLAMHNLHLQRLSTCLSSHVHTHRMLAHILHQAQHDWQICILWPYC